MTAQTHVVTGLPGNGKTLYTISTVKKLAEESGRSVYYHGIEVTDSSALPWLPLDDPLEWHKAPAGSIVVLDEAQKIFVKRPTGARVPEYVAALETLRHSGIELWLITQHPMLIDSHARKLIGDHRHLVRAFGANAATVHRWNSVQEQCDKVRDSSESSVWVYPTVAYGWYKSAEIHTIKRRLPRAFWVLVTVPIIIAVCVWVMFRWYQSRLPKLPEVHPASQLVATVGPSNRPASAVKTKLEWFEGMVPRVPGLAYTAPVYDKITEPVRAPYPAGCVQREASEIYDHPAQCLCYTDQGTRLEMPEPLCRDIAAKGFYMSWDQRPREQAMKSSVAASSGPAVASSVSVVPGRGAVASPHVVAVASSPAVAEEGPAPVGRGHWLPPGPDLSPSLSVKK